MYWSLLLVLALSTIFLVYRSNQKPRIHRNGKRLRTPPSTLPILGNGIKFLQPRHILFDWFVDIQQQYGHETLQLSVPSLPPAVVISSPKNLEFVLKNESVITKGEFFKRRSWDLFGYGIINASGELWRMQRKTALKFFSGENLEVLVNEVLPEVYSETMRPKLVEAAKNGEVLDMQKCFLDLTTMVVGRMAYDMDIDASAPFSKAFDYASDQVGLRFQNPLYPFTELFSSRLSAALVEVKRFGRKIVANAKKTRSHAAFESLITNEEPVFGSLIDSLLETFRDTNIVADAALNFLSAGRDTTAQSFTWTLYALMRHPGVWVQLRTEIETAFAKGSDVDVASLQPSSIPYTMAVYSEALRLYPPVPFEIKQCEADVTLPDGTSMPKNSIIVWCIWAMNRATSTFGEDAMAFKPERWLDKSGLLMSKTPWEFPVFNGGPRACLGKKMAELMAAFLLVTLVKEFEFEEVLDNGHSDRMSQNSLTLPMQDGLPCRVKWKAS